MSAKGSQYNLNNPDYYTVMGNFIPRLHFISSVNSCFGNCCLTFSSIHGIINNIVVLLWFLCDVLTIFNEGPYLTFKSFFNKVPNFILVRL